MAKKKKLKKGQKRVNGRVVLAKGYRYGANGRPVKASKKKKSTGKKKSSGGGGLRCPKPPKGMKVGAIRKIRGRYYKKAKGGRLVKSSAEAARKHRSAVAKKASRKRKRSR